MITQTHTDLGRAPVGEIAADLPGATAVFREFKLNFCCRGDVPLADAARQRGVELSEVIDALDALKASDAPSLRTISTDELIDHILSRYHDVHRRELAELVLLARKVEAVHADHPQAPHGLAALLQQMRGELEVHMKKEELVLFPAMRRGSGARLDAPVAQMRHDHADHGEYVGRLEVMTDDFRTPADACRSWQALYAGVAKLSQDLMEHIHLENNVLFPRCQQVPPS